MFLRSENLGATRLVAILEKAIALDFVGTLDQIQTNLIVPRACLDRSPNEKLPFLTTKRMYTTTTTTKIATTATMTMSNAIILLLLLLLQIVSLVHGNSITNTTTATINRPTSVRGGNTDPSYEHVMEQARQLLRDHQHQQQTHRVLNNQCSTDPQLQKDNIWYTIQLDVFSVFNLKCSTGEWTDLRLFLEKELDEMDLFDDFYIENLNPNLCDDPDPTDTNRRTRRQLRQKLVERDPNNPMVPKTVIDEDDELFQQYLDNPDDEKHRNLFMVIWYDLFYRGGSR